MDMDKQTDIIPKAIRDLEIEVMLYTNDKLFQSCKITQEMRNKAMEIILKSG